MKVFGWVTDETNVDTYNQAIRELRKSLDWSKDGLVNYDEMVRGLINKARIDDRYRRPSAVMLD